MEKTYSNIVSKKKLREVQSWTLDILAKALIPSAGPYGSTTQLLMGNPDTKEGAALIPYYSKDGHTILSNIHFDKVLEESIRKECTEITRYIVKECGDGTTSAIILSSLIFKSIASKLDEKYPPYKIIESLKKVVKEISDTIMNNSRSIDNIEDIRKIAMICTNNNKEETNNLVSIYEKYGYDAYINISASNKKESSIRTYDGMTLDVGYSDPCYINTVTAKSKVNNDAGCCIIKNAHVYAFKDPIDTIGMHKMFNAIISRNILEPTTSYFNTKKKEDLDRIIPTVILAPTISVDMNASFVEIVNFMYSFNEHLDAKPPLLIISNINDINTETYSDIWKLCKCNIIKKYIDPEIEKEEQEKGIAPTLDNIQEFCGFCSEVKSDGFRTTFIEPIGMYEYDENNKPKVENGQKVYSQSYRGNLAFLSQELEVAEKDNLGINTIANIKRRIHALKANMVDYFVGGINMTDRDSVKDLIEDAVKNIRSAAKDGVGYGTNFEGLRASQELHFKFDDELDRELVNIIYEAYIEMGIILYMTTGMTEEEARSAIRESLEMGCPMNFTNKRYDHSVLCTIKQDPIILEVISKIISIMVTTNQSIVQYPTYNLYEN